jgi:hypothetical protein
LGEGEHPFTKVKERGEVRGEINKGEKGKRGNISILPTTVF